MNQKTLISLFAIISVLICISWSLKSQNNVQVTIDASLEKHEVSPWIYGRNNSLSKSSSSPNTSLQLQQLRDAGVTILREGGGNNSTKYNWRRKLSSHPDWYNNVYAQDWDYASRSLQQNLPGTQGLWTLSLIGWAAKTNAHNFGDWAYNQSNWWNGVHQNLAGGGTINTAGGGKALKDGNPELYLEPWPSDSVVAILDHWFNPDKLGFEKSQFIYWNMDNEPEIWNGTHDDVMPVMISAEAFMQRYFETVKKARAIFPEIKIAGPVPANEWQWYNWDGNKILYKGRNHVWLEYFIRRVAEEQAESGIKLLDVIDIHFYPGETKATDIVQSHRVYFDRNYVYPGANGVKRIGASGWDGNINKEYIFGRCNDWLVQYMGKDHGVTFGVTETSVNTNDPNLISVWYASMLGEFARQGVEVFTPWDWKTGMWEVLHLFRRFNKTHYNPSVSSQEEFVSAYPTFNPTGDSATVVLVNRSTDQVKTTEIAFSNFNIDQKPVNWYRINSLTANETFISKQQNAMKSGSLTSVDNKISIELPPLSITSLVLTGTPVVVSNPNPIKESALELSVYPNPSNGFFTIRYSLKDRLEGKILITSVTGKTVYESLIEENKGQNNSLHLNSKNWTQGIYLVSLITRDQNQTVRLVLIGDKQY
jgi:hypothetical protein